MTYSCRYAVVQFLPFAETGEVANIGVVLACPELGFFGFRLAERGWSRIKTFFWPLKSNIYNAALEHLRDELERAKKATSEMRGSDAVEGLWKELIRRRDGMIRYGAPRALLAKDPAGALADVFGRFCDRDFVTPTYQEQRLEQTVRETLEQASLGRRFERARLGYEDFRVMLPFVEFDSARRPLKVIKPLNLAREKPTDILNHGGDWLQRLERLRKHDALPRDVLVAMSQPIGRGYSAYYEVRADFVAQGFQVADAKDRLRIAEFAR